MRSPDAAALAIPARRVIAAHVVALATCASLASFAAACGSGTSPTSTPSRTAATTVTSPTPPAATPSPAGISTRVATSAAAASPTAVKPDAPLPQRPPTARAIAGAASVDMTRGSFTWNGTQADAFAVVTSANRLPVAPGGTIGVPNPAPLALASAEAGFTLVTDSPRTTEAGMFEWDYPAATQPGVAALDGNGVRIIAPVAPGTYVATVLLLWGADATGRPAHAYYHALVDVR